MWVALGLAMVGLAMIAFLLVANASPDSIRLPNRTGDLVEVLFISATALAWVSMIGTGTVLAIRRPSNPIGWLLLLGGVTAVFAFFAEDYVQRVIFLGWQLPGHAAIDWTVSVSQSLPSILTAIWVPLLFPSGHLPSRRWRPVAWAIGTVVVIDVLLRMVTDADDEFGRALPNPVALGGDIEALAESLLIVTTVGLVASIILAYLSAIIRFVRSVGIERQQLKWFLAATSVVFITLIGTALTFAMEAAVADVFYFLNQAAVGLPPLAVGIAVLRYRLYDIDRLISRTISWAIVTAVLVGAFVGVVLVLSTLLQSLAGEDTIVVACSTLIVAALFAPVRDRVQRAVDRRFDRTRYDGERLLRRFGERLRDEVDRDAIRADVVGTLDAAVRPASIGIWLREGAKQREASSQGTR